MDKLKLRLDDLSVTSFEAAPPQPATALVPSNNTHCNTCDTLCVTCRTMCLPYC